MIHLRRKLLPVLLCSIVCATAAPVPAASPPAPATRESFNDRRAAQQAVDDLDAASSTASAAANYADLESRTGAYILRRLAACGDRTRGAASSLPDLEPMNDLLFVVRSCRYLAIVRKFDGGHKLATWLTSHRPTARLLWRAMEDVSSPEDSLKTFHALWSADEKRVTGYDDLAVAFATAAPLTHYIRQPNAATRVEAFLYYTDPRTTFRQDLKILPFEYARFLADTQLSIAERQWARQRHGGTAELPGVYFGVPYDFKYFFSGQPKRISRTDYTLANLERLGGVCVDQAYYAAEVCKAMGIPATIVYGHAAADGGNHAWLACLRVRSVGGTLQAEWDTQTARYPEHRFYTGMLTDPGTGKRIHDSDLVLLGAAAQLPLDRREQADTAATLATWASRAVKQRPEALAEGTTMDPRTAEKLLMAAAERNLAHRKIWDLAVELGRSGDLSPDALDRLFDFVVLRTARDYPDYAADLILRIAPCYEPARRDKIYLRAIDFYRARPDLQGRLMIARGDDFAADGKPDQALKIYRELLRAVRGDLTEILLLAAQRAGDLMVAQNQRGDAIALYRKLWGEAARPRRRTGAYSQTPYYQLGRRLADLLREDGQAAAAEKVVKSVGEVEDPPEVPEVPAKG